MNSEVTILISDHSADHINDYITLINDRASNGWKLIGASNKTVEGVVALVLTFKRDF